MVVSSFCGSGKQRSKTRKGKEADVVLALESRRRHGSILDLPWFSGGRLPSETSSTQRCTGVTNAATWKEVYGANNRRDWMTGDDTGPMLMQRRYCWQERQGHGQLERQGSWPRRMKRYMKTEPVPSQPRSPWIGMSEEVLRNTEWIAVVSLVSV